MSKAKRTIEQVQKEIDCTCRLLSFHDWLTESFKKSKYADEVRDNMLKQQAKVINGLKTELSQLQSEIKLLRR